MKTWLAWDKLLPVPTESGGSSQRSHPLPFTLAHGAARSTRFLQQTASPWAKLQPRGLSSSEGLVLGMHETTPPSGVSTDLRSVPALLQPCPFAPRSAWLPVRPRTTPNPAHSKQAPSCSQHTDIPTWCGAGHGQARRKQSKSKADPLCCVLSSALVVPPSTGAVLLPPKLPECGTCSCAHIQALALAWASCPREAAGCGAGQQLQAPRVQVGNGFLAVGYWRSIPVQLTQLLVAPGSGQGRSRWCQGTVWGCVRPDAMAGMRPSMANPCAAP